MTTKTFRKIGQKYFTVNSAQKHIYVKEKQPRKPNMQGPRA